MEYFWTVLTFNELALSSQSLFALWLPFVGVRFRGGSMDVFYPFNRHHSKQSHTTQLDLSREFAEEVRKFAGH